MSWQPKCPNCLTTGELTVQGYRCPNPDCEEEIFQKAGSLDFYKGKRAGPNDRRAERRKRDTGYKNYTWTRTRDEDPRGEEDERTRASQTRSENGQERSARFKVGHHGVGKPGTRKQHG